MQKSVLLLLAGVALAAGCATNATVAQLKTRAAFDLQCNEAAIDVVPIDPRTNGVRGCGRQATYVEQCKPCANGYVGCECTWLMNSDGIRERVAAPPQTVR